MSDHETEADNTLNCLVKLVGKQDLIELPKIVWDQKARDGTYCRLPYPNHPKGCPNYPKCIEENPPREHIERTGAKWYAVIEEFDLKAHAEAMKLKHPNWSERQCRCLLYWQGSVRKRLKYKAEGYEIKLFWDELHRKGKTAILECPEANGIDMFATMANVGISLQRNPDLVRKIMLIGVSHA